MPTRHTSACLSPEPPHSLPVEISAADSLRDAPEFSFTDTPRLTLALRRGDERAFRFLHAEWNARLMRYCFALATGDEVFAAEVAQATYVRIFRYVGGLPNEVALWDWIARAARSAANDARRIRGRYQNALLHFTEWIRAKVAGESDEDPLLARLDAALRELSGDEQQLIEARYFRHVPLEEIATQMGTSTRAIEGRLARLRQRLRNRLSEEERKSGLNS